MRVELAWRIPRSKFHLFVDRRRRNGLEPTGEDVLTLQQPDVLPTLVDTGIFDHPMQGLVTALEGERTQ